MRPSKGMTPWLPTWANDWAEGGKKSREQTTSLHWAGEGVVATTKPLATSWHLHRQGKSRSSCNGRLQTRGATNKETNNRSPERGAHNVTKPAPYSGMATAIAKWGVGTPTKILQELNWQRLVARLVIPTGILRIPVFSSPVALFSQESRFLFLRNFLGTPSGILSVPGLLHQAYIHRNSFDPLQNQIPPKKSSGKHRKKKKF